MPRFSIKDLLLVITMAAVGLSVEIVLFNYSRALRLTPQIEFVLFVTGAGMIGGGLAAPFHRKKVGAITGASIAIVLLAIALMNIPRVH